MSQRWFRTMGWLATATLMAASVACQHTANLTEVQRVSSGAINVVLLSRDGVLHQKDPFTIEFRSASGELFNVGSVRASANMPMPGMPMFGTVEVQAADVPGRYTAKGNLEMTGGWRIALEWDGPAGRGSVNFLGTVQ